jgi:uncharacterized protein DUF3617
MRPIHALSLLATFAAVTTGQSVDLPLKPGIYSVTSTSQTPGQPASPGTSGQHCVSAADMKDPENVFDPAVVATSRRNEACKVQNFSRDANSIAYDVQCPRAFVHVEAKLSANSYTGTRDVKPRPGAATRVIYAFQGKRVGDCR